MQNARLQCRATAALLLHPAWVLVEWLRGHADRVRDGNALVVIGVPIRVQGLAASELDEKRGRPPETCCCAASPATGFGAS